MRLACNAYRGDADAPAGNPGKTDTKASAFAKAIARDVRFHGIMTWLQSVNGQCLHWLRRSTMSAAGWRNGQPTANIIAG
jgi:hypothetical protein